MSRSRMLADARTALAVREMQLKASELAVGRQVERTEKARQTLIAAEAELTAAEMELAAVLADPMIDLNRFDGWRRARAAARDTVGINEKDLSAEEVRLVGEKAGFSRRWGQSEAARQVMVDARRSVVRAQEERALSEAADLRSRRETHA